MGLDLDDVTATDDIITCPWLHELSNEQLIARIGEASARIDEEVAVMQECHRLLLMRRGDE